MNDYFLADDLSGALDAAAAFHHAGWRVKIALSAAEWPAAEEGTVVGVTTETRNAAPDLAARSVAQAMTNGQARGGRLLYKKIDSTLRGPVAAELAAVLGVLPESRVLFAPANPRVGRTVQQGRLLVHGVPVAETDFARDPVTPVRESSLRALLGAVANERVVIPDALTEGHLADTVATMAAQGGAWIPVGSGALARPVAAATARSAPTWQDRNHGLLPSVTSAGILMIGGSAHPGNRAQVEQLALARGVARCEVTATDIGRGVADVQAALRQAGAATLLAPAQRLESGAALRAIVATAAQVIRAAGVTRVFVTGGETAFALARELGVPDFEFFAEIEPGLSLSLAETTAGRMAWAVKPGGFGDRDTWVRAYDALGWDRRAAP
jgi:uncharacterized protein YgbK (DUF1537 family)